jgi:hypothetical protein
MGQLNNLPSRESNLGKAGTLPASHMHTRKPPIKYFISNHPKDQRSTQVTKCQFINIFENNSKKKTFIMINNTLSSLYSTGAKSNNYSQIRYFLLIHHFPNHKFTIQILNCLLCIRAF